jgi:selenocysteine lyase/cysteine desulfurase
MDCEAVGEALGLRHIAVRSGLHCAPLAHRSAGTFESGTVRVSFSAFNQPWEVDRFLSELSRMIAG